MYLVFKIRRENHFCVLLKQHKMFSVLPNACGSPILRCSSFVCSPKQEAKLGLNSCSKFGVLFSAGSGQINAIGNYKWKIA